MKQSFAIGIGRAFITAIALVSAATSFLYFIHIFSFGEGFLSGPLAVLINGLLGVLVLDGAAFAWLWIYLQDSDNNTTRAIAAFGMLVAVIGSIAASYAYLVLFAARQPLVDVGNLYSATIWLMATIIVIHFALVFLRQYKHTSARIEEKTAEMMAEATDEMLKLTDDYFKARIPGLAQANAQKLTRQLAARFATLSVLTQLEEEAPALPTGQPEPVPAPGSNGKAPDFLSEEPDAAA